MKKRIAVCIYGQIRGDELFKNHFSEWSSDEYDFDFFMSNWIHTYDIKFPFTKSECLAEFKVKHFKGNDRTAKSCYLINKVIRLKESYEMKNGFAYDVVVCTRTDFKHDLEKLYTAISNVDVINKKYDRPIVSLTSSLRVHPNVDGVTLPNDNTFIYNQEGSNLHANLFNLLFLQETHQKDREWSWDEPTNNGHYMHGFCFSYHNFLVLESKLKETRIEQ
jgi:hypothetical protein